MIELDSHKTADQIKVGDPVVYLSSRYHSFTVGLVDRVKSKELLVKFFVGGEKPKVDVRRFTWREHANGARLWAEDNDRAAAVSVSGWDASVLLFPYGPYKAKLKTNQDALFALLSGGNKNGIRLER